MIRKRGAICVRPRIGPCAEVVAIGFLMFRKICPEPKCGVVMPPRNLHQDQIVYALVLVILLYLLAQPMGLDANDRIRLWVEIRLAAECLDPNRVFLEHFRVPRNSS